MLEFLQVSIKDVSGFPLTKRLDGSYWPIENEAFSIYDGFIATQGVNIFELCHDIVAREKVDGVERTFTDVLDGILKGSDPALMGKYAKDIKKIYYKAPGKDENIGNHVMIVTVLLNSRVSQDWFIANKAEIESGMAKMPTIKASLPDFTDAGMLSIFNSTDGKPTFLTNEGKLVWTIEMTNLLAINVIEAIYECCISDDSKASVKEAETIEFKVEDPDFLETSKHVLKESPKLIGKPSMPN